MKQNSKDWFDVYVFIIVAIASGICFSPAIGEEAVGYLEFANKILYEFSVDLSIPGMHGQSLLLLPILLLSGGWLWSSNVLSIGLYLLNIPLIYRYVEKKYSKRTGRIAVYGYLLAAEVLRQSIQGNSFSTQIALIMLTLILIERKNILASIAFAFSVITKPSSIFIFPFINKIKGKKKHIMTAMSLILIGAYFVLTKIQSGMFLNSMGVKSDEIVMSVSHSVKTFVISIYYLFSTPHIEYESIHSFVLLTSPVLILFGIISMLYGKKYIKDAKIVIPAIILSYLAGSISPFFDPLYVLPAILLLIIIGAQFCSQHMRLLPLVLIGGIWQFYYFMQRGDTLLNFGSSPIIYYIIILVAISIYELYKWKKS